MKKDYLIDIYFVDDDDLYLNYFRKKFQPDLPHNLHTYNSGKTFLRHFVVDSKKRRNLKIVILDYLLDPVDSEDSKTCMELLPVIKNHNPNAQVIILSGKANLNINPTASKHSITAFVKKGDNAFDHISTIVKRLTAKYELDMQQGRSRVATRIFVIVLIISVIIILLTLFIHPTRY